MNDNLPSEATRVEGPSLATFVAMLRVCTDRLDSVLGMAGNIHETLQGAIDVATNLDPDQASAQIEAIQAPLTSATAALYEFKRCVNAARDAARAVKFS